VNPRTLLIGLLLCLLPTVATSQTTQVTERRYTLPDHGHFVLSVPRDWKDQVKQPPNRLPPTIMLGPASGTAFQVLITPIWPFKPGAPAQSADQLRSLVERAAQQAKSQSVEKELPLHDLRGASGQGYYFSATDRAPEPGGWKFLTQGTLLVGELTVTFTVLTNEGQEVVVRQVLEALKTARQEGV